MVLLVGSGDFTRESGEGKMVILQWKLVIVLGKIVILLWEIVILLENMFNYRRKPCCVFLTSRYQ
jgi:hypothetical protein